MATYKAITTITWKVDTDKGEQECLDMVRAQLNQFLAPPALDGFSVQVDVAPMKPRKRLEHIASYPAEEILNLITEEECRKEFVVNGQSYWVRMNSDRYHIFKSNPSCCSCGVVGDRMVLDLNPGDSSPHFNLYAEENGALLLMTKDHKIPKSKGGQDTPDNFATMCAICNNLKGNYDLTYEQVGVLRRIHQNKDRLSKKDLRSLIQRTSVQMELLNQSNELMVLQYNGNY